MESQQKYKVYIVVLNWNNYNDTKECLRSIEGNFFSNYKIVLVDNGSTDDSIKRLEREYPHIDIFLNKENVGFAAGCNVGIKHSLENRADCVLLINNDARLEPLSLYKAVQILFSNEKIGIVGGKIKKYNNPSYIETTGAKFIFWPIMYVKSIGAGKLDKGQFDKMDNRCAVSGALMLIKREVFEKVGLLPEEYFFGGEDIEFCLAARKKGFSIIYEPSFVAYHKGGGSTPKGPKSVYFHFLHRQLLMKRNMNYFSWRISRLTLYIYMRFYFFHKYARKEGLDSISKNKLKKAILLAFKQGGRLQKVEKSFLELTL